MSAIRLSGLTLTRQPEARTTTSGLWLVFYSMHQSAHDMLIVATQRFGTGNAAAMAATTKARSLCAGMQVTVYAAALERDSVGLRALGVDLVEADALPAPFTEPTPTPAPPTASANLATATQEAA